VSKVSALDLGALRARLLLALEHEADPDLDGASLFLMAIGACLLAASPESPWEVGVWDSLFRAQSDVEGVNGEDLLAVLGSVTQVLS
jgi:hypothetical protein